jgi:uncharacterized protein
MNEYPSYDESIYRKRWIGAAFRSAVKTFPAVILTGARQVGKSTFLRNEFPDIKYVTLDDFATLRQAVNDPASLWMGTHEIIIDEAQKSPGIFNAIKLAVDERRRDTRFIVSGSSNLLLMKNVSETLAGRAVYFEMFPMSFSEIRGKTAGPMNFISLWDGDTPIPEQELVSEDPVPIMLKGLMPPLMYMDEHRDVLLWWEGYIKTYLERDLRELSQIDSLIDFRRVLESLAMRTANVLNQTDVSRDTGVSQPTVHRYIKLLEVSNLIQRIPAYHQNRAKRMIKSPKVFFIDPGLSSYLSGYYDRASLEKAREFGSFFETLVFLHLRILIELMVPKAKLFYWKTTTGKEVDFVIEQGKNLIACEVKMTSNPGFHDIKNLLLFLEDYPQTTRAVLIHTGGHIKYLHSRIIALPWWWLGQ